MKEKGLPKEYISKALELYADYLVEEKEIDDKYSDRIAGRDDRGSRERYELIIRLHKKLADLQKQYF